MLIDRWLELDALQRLAADRVAIRLAIRARASGPDVAVESYAVNRCDADRVQGFSNPLKERHANPDREDRRAMADTADG